MDKKQKTRRDFFLCIFFPFFKRGQK